MKNTATYLNFQRKIGQLTTSERWFALNRLINYLYRERDHTNKNFDYYLEKHIQMFQDTTFWWEKLRELSIAPHFYKTLRQL